MTSPHAHHTLDDATLRHGWRDWLHTHYTSPLRDPLRRLTGTAARQWLHALHRDGWRAPALARAHGGMGLSLRQQLIYQEELEHHSVARPMDMGLRLLTPVLLAHGTPAQQADYLPRILSGEEVWCQGYSEPGAGSDLARLRTRATVHDTHLVIQGQKTWTTYADDADSIFLLVRTSTEARPQAGITFVLARLDTPGITVRPIPTLSGEASFCEVFLDEVVVPRSQVVGTIGAGWAIARQLLGAERFSHGSPELLRHAVRVLHATGQALGMEDDPIFADALAQHRCDAADAGALYTQLCEAALAGAEVETEFSLLKLFVAEATQRVAEQASACAGQLGGILGPAPALGLPHDLEWLYMITRPLTIFGGTAQVQRNLIATRTLGLPRA